MRWFCLVFLLLVCFGVWYELAASFPIKGKLEFDFESNGKEIGHDGKEHDGKKRDDKEHDGKKRDDKEHDGKKRDDKEHDGRIIDPSKKSEDTGHEKSTVKLEEKPLKYPGSTESIYRANDINKMEIDKPPSLELQKPDESMKFLEIDNIPLEKSFEDVIFELGAENLDDEIEGKIDTLIEEIDAKVELYSDADVQMAQEEVAQSSDGVIVQDVQLINGRRYETHNIYDLSEIPSEYVSIPDFGIIKEVPGLQKYSSAAYFSYYDSVSNLPLAVYHSASQHDLTGGNAAKRPNYFFSSPFFLHRQDFSGSGFQKGHLASAGEFRSNQRKMTATFFHPNMIPQPPETNQHMWRSIETASKALQLVENEVHVVNGVIYSEQSSTFGVHNTVVPDKVYKIIAVESSDKSLSLTCFLAENTDSPLSCKPDFYATNLETIERESGLEFFPKLTRDQLNENPFHRELTRLPPGLIFDAIHFNDIDLAAAVNDQNLRELYSFYNPKYFDPETSRELAQLFVQKHKVPTEADCEALANRLNLDKREVQRWMITARNKPTEAIYEAFEDIGAPMKRMFPNWSSPLLRYSKRQVEIIVDFLAEHGLPSTTRPAEVENFVAEMWPKEKDLSVIKACNRVRKFVRTEFSSQLTNGDWRPDTLAAISRLTAEKQQSVEELIFNVHTNSVYRVYTEEQVRAFVKFINEHRRPGAATSDQVNAISTTIGLDNEWSRSEKVQHLSGILADYRRAYKLRGHFNSLVRKVLDEMPEAEQEKFTTHVTSILNARSDAVKQKKIIELFLSTRTTRELSTEELVLIAELQDSTGMKTFSTRKEALELVARWQTIQKRAFKRTNMPAKFTDNAEQALSTLSETDPDVRERLIKRLSLQPVEYTAENTAPLIEFVFEYQRPAKAAKARLDKIAEEVWGFDVDDYEKVDVQDNIREWKAENKRFYNNSKAPKHFPETTEGAIEILAGGADKKEGVQRVRNQLRASLKVNDLK